MRLNDRIIAALPFSTAGQAYHGDDALTGFGVRVGSKTKTFVLTFGQDRRRITLGRYPIVSLAAARDRARTLLAQHQLGLDQGPPPTPFFKDMLKPFSQGARAADTPQHVHQGRLHIQIVRLLRGQAA